jgi:hypothetical protein
MLYGLFQLAPLYLTLTAGTKCLICWAIAQWAITFDD